MMCMRHTERGQSSPFCSCCWGVWETCPVSRSGSTIWKRSTKKKKKNVCKKRKKKKCRTLTDSTFKGLFPRQTPARKRDARLWRKVCVTKEKRRSLETDENNTRRGKGAEWRGKFVQELQRCAEISRKKNARKYMQARPQFTFYRIQQLQSGVWARVTLRTTVCKQVLSTVRNRIFTLASR